MDYKMHCHFCGEEIYYYATCLDLYYQYFFCDDDCLNGYIKEHTTIVDVEDSYEER